MRKPDKSDESTELLPLPPSDQISDLARTQYRESCVVVAGAAVVAYTPTDRPSLGVATFSWSSPWPCFHPIGQPASQPANAGLVHHPILAAFDHFCLRSLAFTTALLQSLPGLPKFLYIIILSPYITSNPPVMAMPPGFGDRSSMRLDDAASDHSSSSISSPPTSPQNATFASDTIRVAHTHTSSPDIRRAGGVANPNPATSAPPGNLTNATSLHHANANANASTPPAKVKRPRKKKELGPDGKPIDDGKPTKEKKPRKPREPKDKTTASAAGPSRKKIKSEDKPAPNISSSSSSQPRQSTLTELVHTYPQSMPAPNNAAVTPIPSHTYTDGSLRPNLLSHTSASTPTPRPFSSGQNYDPVRSATIDPNPHHVVQSLASPASVQAATHVNRASASPSIASLIDPPVNTKPSHTTYTTSHSPNLSMQHPIVPSQPHSPTPGQKLNGSHAQSTIPSDPSPSMAKSTPAVISSLDGAMDLDVKTKPQQSAKSKANEVKNASKTNSTSHTPNNTRPTPPPAAPKTAGTGLLATSDLFGGASNTGATERRGVNIDLHIKLDPAGGNTINIAQEILHKYGHDAINPRAAAHRQHLLQVAAAANKIDGGSPDDMSVDLSDMADDSNVEMGGMDDTANSAQPADGEKPRKRRKKVEEYDKEDDFIDDTELAWQEAAAVTKDGFFVYSGPLVPPGEAARVETNAPTRGRGRGRGRRAGAAAAGTTHASLAEKKDPGVVPTTTTRGRGRGRGTGTTRKPRITKADRERMEIEKREREAAAGGMAAPAAQPTLAMKSMGASA